METSAPPPTVQPAITSFVIRFVLTTPTPDLPNDREAGAVFRGNIRNVQTDEEITFTRWEDAVRFIQQYVPLEISPGSSVEGS